MVLVEQFELNFAFQRALNLHICSLSIEIELLMQIRVKFSLFLLLSSLFKW